MAVTVYLLYAALTCLLSWMIVYYVKNRRIRTLINQIPGPTNYPIIGTVPSIYAKTPHEHLLRIGEVTNTFRKSNGMHRDWFFHRPSVSLYRQDTVEAALSGSKNITKNYLMVKFLMQWLGESLLTSGGSIWKQKRSLLTPTFHFKILEEYIPIFNKHAEKLNEKLEAIGSNGEKINIYEYFVLTTLDSICETAMGKSVNALEDEDNEYVSAVKRAIGCFFMRGFNPILWIDFFFNLSTLGRKFNSAVAVMHRFTDKIIKERKAANDGSAENKRYKPFLDLLIQVTENSEITDQDLRNEVNTFVFEGHDTTGVSISWMTHLIGSYPEVQEKLQQELDLVLGTPDLNRPISYDDLKDLKYLERIIKESLRLYPPVPAIFREVEHDIQIGKFTIPKGADIIFAIYELHRDPEVFPDPEKFDPDRFLPENSEGRNPFAYIPFSAGPRNCIGQRFAMSELKVLLGRLFHQYKVTSLTPRHEMKPVREAILRPLGGVLVKLEKRK